MRLGSLDGGFQGRQLRGRQGCHTGAVIGNLLSVRFDLLGRDRQPPQPLVEEAIVPRVHLLSLRPVAGLLPGRLTTPPTGRLRGILIGQSGSDRRI